MTKWDNDSFDRVVDNNGKPIKRIGNYVSYQNKIQMKCLKCEHEWSTLPGNIIRLKVGCPKCARNIKMTNEDVDKRLLGRNIRRLENYELGGKSMKWECTICNHQWCSSADNILNRNKRGCGKCKGGIRKPREYYENKLKPRNIELVDFSNNTKNKSTLKCLKCNTKWEGILSNVARNINPSGCPTCLYKREAFVGTLIAKHLPNAKVSTHVPLETPNKNFNVDFVINDKIFVEYNGEHHYKLVVYGKDVDRAKENLKAKKKRDRQLRKYCQKNSITLIELPYTYSDEKIEEAIINIKKVLYDT